MDEQKREPLWSDEDIMAHVRRNAAGYDNVYTAMRFAMQMVRNDYEIVRGHNHERMARLEAELSTLRTRLAALEQATPQPMERVPQPDTETIEGYDDMVQKAPGYLSRSQCRMLAEEGFGLFKRIPQE